MKYSLVFFLIIFTFQLYAQDITNKLGGTSSAEFYDVIDSADKTLFRIQGDGKVGIGTTSPNRNMVLHGGTSESFLAFRTNDSGDTEQDGLLFGLNPGTNSGYLWNYEDASLYFGTKGLTRMIIENEGDIGIGTTSPAYKLDVNGIINVGTNGTVLRCQGDAAIYYNDNFFSWGSGGNFNVFWDGVGINTSNVNYNLEVNGTAGKSGGGSWSNSSDIRLKDVTCNYNRGLEEILNLNPVIYKYKKDNARELPSDEEYVGFIAQDVQDYFPKSVSEGDDGYLDFNMHSINVAVINAIKELSSENKALKKRIEQLENR